MVHLATKTILAIDQAIADDQGASYRGWLGKVIHHMDDAYRTDEFPFRSHLGASGIGGECARAIWYGFRWVTKPQFDGRLLRLFNRGHLEEARFIAMLLMIGVEVYQQDGEGKQFRISDAGGHFGGSGDGVAINLPDLEPGVPALLEFKTSADKPFKKVEKEGVRAAKFEHFVQMQVYMDKMGIACALYMVVNKNNDDLYGEIIHYDRVVARQFIDRGVKLVFVEEAPDRISNSPGWFQCSWCDHKPVCHLSARPHNNCRTCHYSVPREDGAWSCISSRSPHKDKDSTIHAMTKEEQFAGCEHYSMKETIKG